MSGGTIFHATRRLMGHERRYLALRVIGPAISQGFLALVLIALALWAIKGDDAGGKFMFALLLGPLVYGMFKLGGFALPYARDLRADRVESVMGKVGTMSLGAGLVPIHLGDHVFEVLPQLLRYKQLNTPIVVEYIAHTGIAVAIDGQSNLTGLDDWFKEAWQ